MLAFMYYLNFEIKLDTFISYINLNAMHHYNFKIAERFMKLVPIISSQFSIRNYTKVPTLSFLCISGKLDWLH